MFKLSPLKNKAADSLETLLNVHMNTHCNLHHRSKGKDTPNRPEGPWGLEVQLYSLLTSALEGDGWSAPRPGRFTPRKDTVPIIQEAGWVPGSVWMCAKNLSPTGIRSPDRPARSESLYRLSYPVPYTTRVTWIFRNTWHLFRLSRLCVLVSVLLGCGTVSLGDVVRRLDTSCISGNVGHQSLIDVKPHLIWTKTLSTWICRFNVIGFSQNQASFSEIPFTEAT
jgi:hypothetical protein